jgi:hypothetical protein
LPAGRFSWLILLKKILQLEPRSPLAQCTLQMQYEQHPVRREKPPAFSIVVILPLESFQNLGVGSWAIYLLKLPCTQKSLSLCQEDKEVE